MLTKACHRALYTATCIQPTPYSFKIFLPYTPRSSMWTLYLRFSNRNLALLINPTRAIDPVHLILTELITLKISGEEWTLRISLFMFVAHVDGVRLVSELRPLQWISSLCHLLYPPDKTSFLGPNTDVPYSMAASFQTTSGIHNYHKKHIRTPKQASPIPRSFHSQYHDLSLDQKTFDSGNN
jgi:hypothetical protein